MHKTMQSQIVHESETQRQHVRLPIPAHISIQGVLSPLKDLSSGGFCAKDIRGTFAPDRLLPVILRLTFPQFTMDIALDSQIQHYNPSTETLGCRFVNVAPEQIASINHILTSFIAGDIVGSSDMLAIAARDNFTRARLPANNTSQGTTPEIRRQIPGMLLILFIGAIAISIFGLNIYDKLFTLKSQDGIVLADTIDMRTQIGGTVNFHIRPDAIIVTEGEKIASVDTGGLLPDTILSSPCNCYVAERLVRNGEYKESEQPVARLIPISSKPWIQATLPHKDASKVNMNDKATIKIFGSPDAYNGHVAALKSGRNGENPIVLVSVKSEKRIPIDLADRPASVVFYTK